MLSTEMEGSIVADKFLIAQVGSEIVEVKNVIGDAALRVQLPEFQSAGANTVARKVDRAIADTVHPRYLTFSLKWSAPSIRRVGNPELSEFRGSDGESNVSGWSERGKFLRQTILAGDSDGV